ncbi:MAG: response regulator transcription factor [Alcanivorax sp.]|nr:response regulator transcription factor [Alcanivorax sp.]
MNVTDARGRVRTLVVHLDSHYSFPIDALGNHPALLLIGTTSLCQTAKRLAEHGPAVVLLSTGSTSLVPALIADIIRNTPSMVLLALPRLEQHLAIQALQLGVRGLIRRDAAVAELVRAIVCVGSGEVWAPRQLLYDAVLLPTVHAKRQPGDKRRSQWELTPREEEIVERLCAGLSNKEIARELNISDKTVKTHLQRIYRKSHVRSRLQLAMHH